VGRKGRRIIVIPFLLPALIFYGYLFVYPAFQALWVSLHSWSGFTPQMDFIGLQNFVELTKDPIFHTALRNTALIMLAGGVLTFVLTFLFVGIVSRRGIKGKSLWRAVLFFPNVVPPVALGVLWGFIYNYDFGILNAFLRLVGLDSLVRTWLDIAHVVPSILIMMAWAYMGFYVVMMLAGIDKIPPDYYEAAVVEGAGEWQIFFRVTVPLLWDVVVVAITLWVIGALKTFDIVYVMTEGGPANASKTIAIQLYEMAFGFRAPIFRMGYATAMGVVLLILVIVGVGVVRVLTRRESVEY